MESWKSKKRAFSAINSDQGIISEEITQVLDSTYSEINSEIELENGNDTSQQNTDNDMPFTALVTDDDLKPGTDIEIAADSAEHEKSREKPNWIGEPTRLLLDLVKKTQPKLGKHGPLRNKTKMFNYLSNEMKKQGFEFSAVQVENKIRSVERQYKRDKTRGKTSRYQRDLDQIFQQPFKCRNRNEDTGSDANTDMEDSTGANIVDPHTARVQREVQRELQKTLVKIATERQQYHNKVLYYLKKKEEREQRREERAQTKLKLLEAFIKQL